MRKFLFPAIVGALLLMFTDWYLIGSANHSYQEKIRILTVMIEEQQKGRDSLQAASELLKGAEDRQGKAGAEKLKAYGYLEGQENSFSLERKRTVRTIVMCSGFVYLLYLFSLYWLAEQWKKQRRQELEELSWVLEQFSGHVYETDFIERLSEKETELERIAGQLAALSEQLRYNEERLGKEKEETVTFYCRFLY